MRPQPTTRLRPYQNYLVVLARRPDAYGYLKTLHSDQAADGRDVRQAALSVTIL